MNGNNKTEEKKGEEDTSFEFAVPAANVNGAAARGGGGELEIPMDCNSSNSDSDSTAETIIIPPSEFTPIGYNNNSTQDEVSSSTATAPAAKAEGSVCNVVESVDDGIEELLHFSWTQFLNDHPKVKLHAAPVSGFSHVFLHETYNALVQPGVYVEYEVGMKDGQVAYWIGRVEELQGYLVRVLPVGLRVDENNKRRKNSPRYIWLNFLTDCKRVGAKSTSNGCFLSPPAVTDSECLDWKKILVSQLRGEASISKHLEEFFKQKTKQTVREGLEFEVHDTQHISQYKLATLKKVVGDRFYFKYWDDDMPDFPRDGFWCHKASGLFRPKGWCKVMGIRLDAPPNYKSQKLRANCLLEEADPDTCVEVGMKLECVDPVQPFQICAATVIEVLKDGFFLVRFDHADDDFDPDVPNNDSMYVHITSYMIFECGFAESNGIELVPPKEYENKQFSWAEYLATNKLKSIKLSKRPTLDKVFEINHRVEAVDQVDSSLICAAIIREVKGRLLRIHFDGWDDDYDQWMDAESQDLYPIGWCESMGYPVAGPKGGSLCRNRKIHNVTYPTRSRLFRGEGTTAKSISLPAKSKNKPQNVSRPPPLKRKKIEHHDNDAQEPEAPIPVKRNGVGRKKTIPVEEGISVCLVSHEEVKAEAIKLGKTNNIATREKLKATLEKLKLQPPPPKKPKPE